MAGFALLLAGVAMLLLPGPGWAAIALGLALLAPDFPWAARALDRVKALWHRLRTRMSAADDGRVR